MNNKVTMKDVAEAAGVSVATVSYIVNDRKDQKISEDTKKKVLQIINLLGYYPNQNARALANKKIRNICLITRDTDNIFYNSEIYNFTKKLSEFFHGNNFQLNLIGYNDSASINNYDALIAFDLTQKEFLKIANSTFNPIIALNSYINDPVFYQINLDYEKIRNHSNEYFNDSFSLYVSDTNNLDRKLVLEEIFDDVIYIDTSSKNINKNNKNVLVFEKSLYNYLKNYKDLNIFYYELDNKKIFETIIQSIKLVEQRIQTDEHYVLI